MPFIAQMQRSPRQRGEKTLRDLSVLCVLAVNRSLTRDPLTFTKHSDVGPAIG